VTIPTWAKVGTALVAVVALVALGLGWYRAIGRNAVLASQEQATRHSLDSLAVVSVRVDSVYVRDTLTLTHETTRYVTVRDTLLLHIHDTVTVLRFVQIADSTIKACTVLRSACDSRHAVDSATSAGWQHLYAVEKASRPSAVLTIGKEILIGAAAFGLGRIGH
jgi:hypothetical protein